MTKREFCYIIVAVALWHQVLPSRGGDITQIDIRSLIKGDTTTLDFSYDTKAPEELPDVRFPHDIKLCGTIKNMAGYMTLSAKAELPYSTHCARCFREIEGVFPFTFERSVAVKGTLSDEESDDYLIAEKGMLDPDERVREAILLDFPMVFLCKDDCKGLCAKCGKDLNEGDCSCPKKEIDPRLAILGKLLDK